MTIDFAVLTSVGYIFHITFVVMRVNILKLMFVAGLVSIFALACIERGLGPDKYVHILRIHNWLILPQSMKFVQVLALYKLV